MNTVPDAFLLKFIVVDGVLGKWATSLEPQAASGEPLEAYLVAYGSPRKV